MKKITKVTLFLASTLLVFANSKATFVEVANDSETYDMKIQYHDIGDKLQEVIVKIEETKGLVTNAKKIWYKQVKPDTGKVVSYKWWAIKLPEVENEDKVLVKMGSRYTTFKNPFYYEVEVKKGAAKLIMGN